ncbi:PilZ domain-containing protein [uncultured Roseibium sp.]|uniref:PilZ domain-containing protein n=1 Tax=uncultured Roseibium sp. TaxID=1936171 RepID=UPI0026307B77|nr:PilZ domain-containing protein [uncultured Roseibium sp.]
MNSSVQKLREEARIFPRKRCKWPGILKLDKEHQPCVVEDISAGGCRIATKTKGLKPKAKIVLEVESRKLRFHGEIRWVRTDELGIEFLYQD